MMLDKLPINWNVILNPVNWFTVILMLAIAGVALHIFLPNVNVPGVTSHSLNKG